MTTLSLPGWAGQADYQRSLQRSRTGMQNGRSGYPGAPINTGVANTGLPGAPAQTFNLKAGDTQGPQLNQHLIGTQDTSSPPDPGFYGDYGGGPMGPGDLLYFGPGDPIGQVGNNPFLPNQVVGAGTGGSGGMGAAGGVSGGWSSTGGAQFFAPGAPGPHVVGGTNQPGAFIGINPHTGRPVYNPNSWDGMGGGWGSSTYGGSPWSSLANLGASNWAAAGGGQPAGGGTFSLKRKF